MGPGPSLEAARNVVLSAQRLARSIAPGRRAADEPAGSAPVLIVGLGNPGRRYERSRHNVGFQCVERIARQLGIAIEKRERQALTAASTWDGRPVVLIEPQTYVNASGPAVAGLVRKYRVDPARLLVVYDDMDLPLGSVRVRARGSHGGHNGMRSILLSLQTQEVPRLRVGIGRPDTEPVASTRGRTEAIDHVLGGFTGAERRELEPALERAVEAVACFVEDGIEAAMNRCNHA